jgi:hypothetical protein
VSFIPHAATERATPEDQDIIFCLEIAFSVRGSKLLKTIISQLDAGPDDKILDLLPKACELCTTLTAEFTTLLDIISK